MREFERAWPPSEVPCDDAARRGRPDEMMSIRQTLAHRVWGWWTRAARTIGEIQARVVLAVFYFVFFAPFALVIRWFHDPLQLKPRTRKGWHRVVRAPEDPLERATRQF